MLLAIRTVSRGTKHQHRHCYCARSLGTKPLLPSASTSSILITERQRLFEHQQSVIPKPFILPIRQFSLTQLRLESEPLKPSSKVEVTVKALKENEKNEPKPAPTTTAVAKPKKPIMQKIKDELLHYYHGFRLLFIDIKISYGLVWRVLNGNTLTRREYRLLMRTVGDMFRLVPFSVFIIVPFMEFLLPFFIKFFPGMLPSTFQTATEKEDKLKQNLKVKLEMAKFLQQTLDDMAVQQNDHYSESAKDFVEWFNKVRTSGEQVTNEEILKFSKLFHDEITLDSLSRSQLVALCRVLEVQTLGTNNLLRFQLRMKLRQLAADDKMIQKEGVDSLSLWEVQQACRARGMRAYGVTEARLRAQLADWLDLSLNNKVPPSLLLLSRALMLPEAIPTEDKLKATISSLPEHVVTKTKAAIGESEGKIDNRVQLELIKEEVRQIREERKELKDAASEAESKDVEIIEDALDAISREKKIVEKVEIKDLKEQLSDYKEDVEELNEVRSAVPEAGQLKESVAAKRLYKRVNNMVAKMDQVLTELEQHEKAKKEADVADGIGEDELLKIDEVMAAIKKIKNAPDEARLANIEKILSKIDDDQDGAIKVEDVLKVIEFIGKENVNLSSRQLDELMDLLEKEEIIEVESKIEKALKKEQKAKQETKSGADGSGSGEDNGGQDQESGTPPSQQQQQQSQSPASSSSTSSSSVPPSSTSSFSVKLDQAPKVPPPTIFEEKTTKQL